MGWWIPALVLAMALAAAYFGWDWFVRYFRGGVDDPQNADSAAVMLLWGCAMLALAAIGLVYWVLTVFGVA